MTQTSKEKRLSVIKLVENTLQGFFQKFSRRHMPKLG